MSDQQNAGEQPTAQGAMPQPTPVFDVTLQHLYGGRVHKQLWIFFFIAVSFLLGAWLPWKGGQESMGLPQAILAIFAFAGVVGGYFGLKGRRPALTPIMFTEMIAIVFLAISFVGVTADRDAVHNARLDAIGAQMNGMRQGPEYDALKKQWDATDGEVWGVADLLGGPFTTMRAKTDDPARIRYEQAWSSFGTGFFLTALTAIFTFFFMAMTIVGAMKAGKAKQEAVAAERAANRRGALGKDAKAEGEKKA
ncbi:MAG: hypothetical protein R3F20_05970 [Planctomycetota bacterium]